MWLVKNLKEVLEKGIKKIVRNILQNSAVLPNLPSKFPLNCWCLGYQICNTSDTRYLERTVWHSTNGKAQWNLKTMGPGLAGETGGLSSGQGVWADPGSWWSDDGSAEERKSRGHVSRMGVKLWNRQVWHYLWVADVKERCNLKVGSLDDWRAKS